MNIKIETINVSLILSFIAYHSLSILAIFSYYRLLFQNSQEGIISASISGGNMNNAVYCLLFGTMAVAAAGVSAQAQIVSRKVGGIEVNLIAEGIRRGNPPRFVNAGDDVIKQYIPDGTVDTEVNMYVVKTKEGTVVIDTGFGAGILEGLQKLGIAPESVKAVILTHTHGDHTGGLLKDGKAVFPNAALYLSAKELDFWNKGGGANFVKAYKVTTFEPSELGAAQPKPSSALPLTGITPFAAYGHTPGHTVYLVESEGQKLLIAGDLVNVGAVQFPRPDIATAYDSDAAAAAASRKRVLEYAAKNAVPFTGMHVVFPAIGSVAQTGAGFTFRAF
jgi:glyoxylase-like metal-dependent hydrolase (beta-lactamase superfamily II)